MPRALLVDTNFSAVPIARALEKRGIEVHVIGKNKHDALAKVYKNYHQEDYTELEALYRIIDKVNPDYLIPGGNDQSYIACTAVNEDMRFDGIDSKADTMMVNDKSAFRAAADAIGIPIPRSYAYEEMGDVRSPIVVKPADSFSGKGITFLKSPSSISLASAVANAESHSCSRKAVIQEYIDGQLYSHSAFLIEGNVVNDFWVSEYSSANPYVVDTSFLAKDLSNHMKKSIRDNVEKFFQTYQLKNGLFHTQFIKKDKNYYFIDVTRRCPGDLYSVLIERSTGFDYAGAYISGYVGKLGQGIADKNIDSANERYVLRHTLSQMSSITYTAIEFSEPLLVQGITTLATSGDSLLPSPMGRVAVAFFETKNQRELIELKDRLLKKLVYKFS